MQASDAARATTFQLHDGVWVVIGGDLDRPDVELMKREVLSAAATGGRIILDMRSSTYFGAAAIGMVSDTVRAAPCPVDILAPRGAERLLRLCGLGSPRLRYWAGADDLLTTLEPLAAAPEPVPWSPKTAWPRRTGS